MRIEYVVGAEPTGRWSVRRGFTAKLEYASEAQAVQAARTLARTAADRGDIAIVKVQDDEGLRSVVSFAPDIMQAKPRVRFDPEHDQRFPRTL